MPAADHRLATEIAGCVRRGSTAFASSRAEAKVALSLLREAEIDAPRLYALMWELKRLELAKGFLRLAHPKNSDELLPFLIQRGIGWTDLVDNYEWEVSDSIDVFFGVVLGVFGSMVEGIVGLANLTVDAAKAAAERPEVLVRVAAAIAPPTSVVRASRGLARGAQDAI